MWDKCRQPRILCVLRGITTWALVMMWVTVTDLEAQKRALPQPKISSSTNFTRASESPAFDPFGEQPSIVPATVRPPTIAGEVTSGAASAAPQNGPLEPWSLTSLISPARFKSSGATLVFVGLVSMAPALFLMTTSFVRLSIVFSLLRQAIGAQILPSNQILTTLAIFLTVCIMWPTWSQVYDDAIVPYTNGTEGLTTEAAWQRGIKPIRSFMSQQIELAGNSENVVLFYETLPSLDAAPESYDDVPLRVLMPAYLLSELKVAFLLGFQVYLPFVVIDVFVSAVTASMGMLMLPPLSISLPLKLIVFVMVDGWNLLAGTLMTSFIVPGG